jgi:hypothetical protein
MSNTSPDTNTGTANTNTSTTIIDFAEARRVLQPSSPQLCVANDPAKGCELILRAIGPTTLVAIRPDRGMDGATWLDTATLANAANWATQRSAAGSNLYFTLNKPLDGLGKKPAKSDIEILRGNGADIDAKDGRSLDDTRAAIAAVPYPPSLIVMSGGGWQPLWLFGTPIDATPEAVSRVEATGRTIAALTGGDAVQNIDRIFRLPFTVNYPNQKKREQGREPCLSGIILAPGGQP